MFNSLAPGKFEWNFRHAIFKQILVIDGWCTSCEIAQKWMSLDFSDDQSTLVQVMAWCHHATSHYLSQCWPRSLSPYGVTRPQWVKSNIFHKYACVFFCTLSGFDYTNGLRLRSAQGSFLYAPRQWETMLYCNVTSHWLGIYIKWSRYLTTSPAIQDR